MLCLEMFDFLSEISCKICIKCYVKFLWNVNIFFRINNKIIIMLKCLVNTVSSHVGFFFHDRNKPS